MIFGLIRTEKVYHDFEINGGKKNRMGEFYKSKIPKTGQLTTHFFTLKVS